MTRVDRCVKCDGDVLWMEFKKSQCCVWCGLHYDENGKENPKETPPYDTVPNTDSAPAESIDDGSFDPYLDAEKDAAVAAAKAKKAKK